NAAAFAIGGAHGCQGLTPAGQDVVLDPNTTHVGHIPAGTAAANCATYNNTASLTSANAGTPNSGASPVAIVLNCANLTITKVADHASANAGATIGYTVTISNTGAGDANGVSLTDSLPGGPSGHFVHWVIDPASANAAAFAIGGADGSQALTLAGQPVVVAHNSTLVVHITAG